MKSPVGRQEVIGKIFFVVPEPARFFTRISDLSNFPALRVLSYGDEKNYKIDSGPVRKVQRVFNKIYTKREYQ